MSEMNPPPESSRTREILKAELGHLREYMGVRFDGLVEKVGAVDRKVETTCATLEELEDQVRTNANTLTLHNERLCRLEKFQAGLLSAVLRWGSLGAGAMVTLVLILAGLTKAWGWW